MIIERVETEAPRREFLTSPSLACDLSWLLWQASHAGRGDLPLAAQALTGRGDLVQRIRTFWGETGTGVCFTEVQILAHHAGSLGESSPPALWSAIERAVASVPTDLGLESESSEDRSIFLRRLEQLKASPALVQSYVALLREAWDLVDAMWQSALPELEECGRRVVAQLENGRGLGELVGESCEAFESWLPAINAHIEAGQPLLVVPCLFFGKSLYLEFPGLTIVGSGFADNVATAWGRTQLLARRLKAVADPTRLALLHYLSKTPSTVGDLAASFALAQPTVSMHMKSLREAGLVHSDKTGGRTQLSADPTAVDGLLDELRRLIVLDTAGTATSDPASATP